MTKAVLNCGPPPAFEVIFVIPSFCQVHVTEECASKNTTETFNILFFQAYKTVAFFPTIKNYMATRRREP